MAFATKKVRFAIERKTRILIVDDDKDNLEIMGQALENDGYIINKSFSGEDALHKIRAWSPHLILLDVSMPGIGGIKALEQIRKLPEHEYIAVIFVSGNLTTEDIVLGLDAGADDYLIKPFRVAELLARVRAKLRIKAVHDQLRMTMKRLEGLVETDDLTGLLNMRALYKRLDGEILRSKRFKKDLSCIMFDLDHFKKVNDNHDHLFGSFVLSEISKIIKDSTRAIDISARYGGDEFLVLLPETDLHGATRVAERMRSSLAIHTFNLKTQKAQVTASFGVTCHNFSTKDVVAEDFIRVADQMLYEAKNGGRNCVKSQQIK